MKMENTNETVKAFCDCCDNEAKAEKTQLENRGWYLGQREQFCPECNQ
jgi:hypothetical protein